jgi:predicted nucleotidyltransferase
LLQIGKSSIFEQIINSNMIGTKQLAKEIKQHLNESLNNIVSDVVIFGSRIKGQATKNSDYDVLIVLNTNYDRKIQKSINDLCYDFDLKYNIFLDTQIISEFELNNSIRGKHPVFRNALKEGLHA